MNYRHIYHAGAFSDVVKHCVLLTLIDALKRKDKPFCVLDTHAGIGCYSLHSTETQKTREYQNGIQQLISASEPMPAIINEYLAIVRKLNAANQLTIYPGSPWLALEALRPDDRLIACELHDDDVITLKEYLDHSDQIAIHHMNGYHAMKAFLPPIEARGLVLIDPPFELTSEFDDILDHLELALKHWRGGVYAIWYPIKDRYDVNNFYRGLRALNFPHLLIEFSLTAIETETGLQSCGIAIINPPWKTQETLSDEVLPYLANALHAQWSIHSENL